jgi:hypothetical protein
MSSENDLFVRLRRYTPSEERDPLEDYITEAFCWLLSNHTRLAQALLAHMGLERLDASEATWKTQVRTRVGVMDMVCSTPDEVVIFEHKTYSSLHNDQLLRYRAWGDEQRDGDSTVVLITPYTHDTSERADINLTWGEVCTLLGDVDLAAPAVRDSFVRLLMEEGFGPPAPVSHAAILTYLPSVGLERSLDALMERALELDWSHAYDLMGTPMERRAPSRRPSRGTPRIQDGRIGIELEPSWRPGVFVGVVLDGQDHKVEPSQPSKGPDMCLILDLSNKPDFAKGRQAFLGSTEYADLLERLRHDPGRRFDVLDHLGTHPSPNPWHILFVRRPLVDVLAGTQNFDEQLTRFRDEAFAMVEFMFGAGELRALRPA